MGGRLASVAVPNSRRLGEQFIGATGQAALTDGHAAVSRVWRYYVCHVRNTMTGCEAFVSVKNLTPT